MKCLRVILKYRLWNALCKKKYRERAFDFENIVQVSQLLLNRDFYRFLVFKDCLQRHARKWDQLCKLAQDFWQKKIITDHNWYKNKMSSIVKNVKKTVINFFALKCCRNTYDILSFEDFEVNRRKCIFKIFI